MKSQAPGLLSTFASAASDYVAHFCKFSVHEFLARGISKGSLTFLHEDGSATLFGESETDAIRAGRPTARITLHHSRSFYARVAATADIGFAEAFMAADFTVDKPDRLTDVFRILILNRDKKTLSPSRLLLSTIGAKINTLVHTLNRNTLSGSQRNIAAHYDLSNDLFATFLGDTWTYSCAYFGNDQTAMPGAVSLDVAQHAKIDMILDKARITADCHVLDIGCGWGELAIRAVQRTGCCVTGITLSHEQLRLARARAASAGVSDRAQFELVDYRALAKSGASFDRVVSVEMIEAVGHEFLGDYFEAIQRMVRVDGVVVVQMITTPEQRYAAYRSGADFIQKHVFPGGVCPSFEAVVCAVAKRTQFCVESVENIGPHYATTLVEWRRRFLESVNSGEVGKAGFDEVFVRKWVYYFCYCEAGFATRTLGVLQVVLSGSNNTSVLGGAPVSATGVVA